MTTRAAGGHRLMTGGAQLQLVAPDLALLRVMSRRLWAFDEHQELAP